MRISDWSSDVCSSDLRAAIYGYGDGRRKTGADRQPPDRFHRQEDGERVLRLLRQGRLGRCRTGGGARLKQLRQEVSTKVAACGLDLDGGRFQTRGNPDDLPAALQRTCRILGLSNIEQAAHAREIGRAHV